MARLAPPYIDAARVRVRVIQTNAWGAFAMDDGRSGSTRVCSTTLQTTSWHSCLDTNSPTTLTNTPDEAPETRGSFNSQRS